MRSVSLGAIGLVTLFTQIATAQEQVTLPLAEWTRQNAQRDALRAARAAQAEGDAVVVGKTVYRGRSDGRNLEMKLSLRAQLSGGSGYKAVPIIGTDVVVRSARANGQPVALIERNDQRIWVTNRSGVIDMEVDFVIPPRGPRGSIEYAFGVIESPVTTLAVHLPTRDLSPKVTPAVTQKVDSIEDGTSLSAVLAPTTRIHIMGLYDVDRIGNSRPAKLYSDTQNLISLSDDTVELFSAIRLTILHARQKVFRVALPAGFDLVSADGQGAFQYRVETVDHQPVLIGETAFGIEDQYEISLRLKRALATGETSIGLPIPRLLDVERDTGSVAVEVPGRLSIKTVDDHTLVPIDVRELPSTLVASSVSPIVRAFRYSGHSRPSMMEIARYPEAPLESGSIDRLRATSVITADGKVMTDLMFTMRNNLRPYLVLDLNPEHTVQSATLDGRPIKPSRDAKGRVLLPLVRSNRSEGRLSPFRVQLVYEQQIDALGWFGRLELALPTVGVPISAVDWAMYIPGGHRVSALDSNIRPQTFVKNARWQRPALVNGGMDTVAAPPRETTHAAGAMSVSLRLPKSGSRFEWRRFWVDHDEPVRLGFYYGRRALVLALQMLLFLFAIGVTAGAFLSTKGAVPVRLGIIIASSITIAEGLGFGWAVLVIVISGGMIAVYRRWPHNIKTVFTEVVRTNVRALAQTARAWWSHQLEAFQTRRATHRLWAIVVPMAQATWWLGKLVAIFLLTIGLIAQLGTLWAVLSNPL